MWLLGSADMACPRPPPVLTIDRLTLQPGMRVASKVRNLPSIFGHDRPLRSGIIRYVRDRRTDRWIDGRTNVMLIVPFPTIGGIIIIIVHLDVF